MDAPADAEITRYITGNAADVNPALHGPVLDLGGGGGDVDEAFQWMFDQVRGCTDCDTKLDVVILRSSGADGYNQYLFEMKGVDSVETLVITDLENSNKPEVEQTVRNAEVVFFAGGDQCNYVKYFRGTVVESAVESVYAKGGGIGGTSAGCAIQGEYSFDACTDTVLSAQALADPYDKRVSLTKDFFLWKYMEGTITDQHFVERDRMGRLLVFLARLIQDGVTDAVLSVAVDAKTSVVIDQNGIATVLGAGPAYFILADHPPEICKPQTPLTYKNYKFWRRNSGETFDLHNRPSTGYYSRSVMEGVIQGNPYQDEAK
jgi:cyanophycinase